MHRRRGFSIKFVDDSSPGKFAFFSYAGHFEKYSRKSKILTSQCDCSREHKIFETYCCSIKVIKKIDFENNVKYMWGYAVTDAINKRVK